MAEDDDVFAQFFQLQVNRVLVIDLCFEGEMSGAFMETILEAQQVEGRYGWPCLEMEAGPSSPEEFCGSQGLGFLRASALTDISSTSL